MFVIANVTDLIVVSLLCAYNSVPVISVCYQSSRNIVATVNLNVRLDLKTIALRGYTLITPPLSRGMPSLALVAG